MNSRSKGVWILVVLAAIALSPLVSAAELSDVQILRGDQPLSVIVFATDYEVDVSFSITGENITSIIADLSELNANPAQQLLLDDIIISQATCAEEEGMLTCTIENKVLNVLDGDLSLSFTVVSADGEESFTEDITLAESTDRPQVVFIGPRTCADGGECFIHTGLNEVVVRLTGSSAGFSQKNIYYRITGGAVSSPLECTETECTGTATATCTDGSGAVITLTGFNGEPSQDDVGNVVRGNTQTEVTCDNTPPVIESLEVAPATGGETPTGRPITIVADVREENPVFIEADFEAFGGATERNLCVRQDGLWHCELSTNDYDPGPYEADLPITVLDAAGNRIEEQVLHKILESIGNQESDFWSIRTVYYSPSVFNKRFLSVSDNTVYVYADLNPQVRGARIAGVQASTCTPEGEDRGQAALRLYGDYFEQDALMFQMELAGIPEGDQVTFVCPVRLYTSYRNQYYENPEEEEVRVTISYITKNDIGTNLQEEIKRIRDDEAAKREKLNQYRSIMRVAKPACEAMIGIQGVSAVSSSIAAVTEPIPFAQGVSAKARSISSGTQGVFQGLAGNTAVLQFCRFVTCQHDYNRIMTDTLGELPGVDEGMKLAGYGSDANYSAAFDPYKSKYLAYASACLPAIIVTEDRESAVQCEYAQCLSAGTEQGMPVGQCKETKEVNECRYVVGDVMEILPHTALLRRIGENVKALLGNPITFFTTAGAAVACEVIPENIAYHACKVPKAISAVGSIKAMLDNWLNIGAPSAEKEYCEYVLDNIDASNQRWVPYITDPTINPGKAYNNGAMCDPYVGCALEDSQYSVRFIGDSNDGAATAELRNYQIFDREGQFIGTLYDLKEDIPSFSSEEETGTTPPGTDGPGTGGEGQTGGTSISYDDVVNPDYISSHTLQGTSKPQTNTVSLIQETKAKIQELDEKGVLSEQDQELKARLEADLAGYVSQHSEEIRAKKASADNCEKWLLTCDESKDQKQLKDMAGLSNVAMLQYSDYLDSIFTSEFGQQANDEFVQFYTGTGNYEDEKTYYERLADLQRTIQENELRKQTQESLKDVVEANQKSAKDQLDELNERIATETNPETLEELYLERDELETQIEINEIFAEKTENDIEEAEKAIDDANDDLRKEQETFEKLNRERFAKQEFHERFREDPWNAYGEMIRFGRSFNGIVNWVDINGAFVDSWENAMQNIFHTDVLEWATGDFESRICDTKNKQDDIQSGQVFVSGAGNALRPGAHVEGERSEKITLPSGGEIYNYYVTASVTPNIEGLESEALPIHIYLKQGNIKETLFETELTEDKPTFGTGATGIDVNNTRAFGEVCIGFGVDNKRDLYTYFDYLDDDIDTAVCNRLFQQ